MIQFAIETLTVILLVLVLHRFPRFTRLSSPPTHLFDILISLAAGVLMTMLVLVANSFPITPKLSPYFAQNSWLLAKGRNVVNVILVDFRGLDTLGEITVLSTAALGVYALSKLVNPRLERPITPFRRSRLVHSLVLQTSARLIMPLLLLFFHFLVNSAVIMTWEAALPVAWLLRRHLCLTPSRSTRRQLAG